MNRQGMTFSFNRSDQQAMKQISSIEVILVTGATNESVKRKKVTVF